MSSSADHSRRFKRFAAAAIARAQAREPDEVILIDGTQEYLRRWHDFTSPFGNAFIHQGLCSDPDWEQHCHPWPFVSRILHGEYTEVLPRDQSQAPGWDFVSGYTREIVRRRGDVIWHWATDRHRLVVQPGTCFWSYVITGPELRDWGFHKREGFVRSDLFNGRCKRQLRSAS